MADMIQPHFQDADAAREYVEAMRWPNGPVCPHCKSNEAYKITPKRGSKTRKGVHKCKSCRKQFTVTVGTIFADSHIPLNKWLMAIHLLCSSKKGISAHQLHRMLGLTYKSAWFMAHRIRYATTQEPLSSKLGGTVEVDETYVGGYEKGKRGKPGKDSKKTAVVSMVERSLVKGPKGCVRSVHVERVTVKNLRPVLNETLTSGTNIHTDEAVVYYKMRDDFPAHDSVNHGKKEYVRREKDGKMVTTNSAENYFSILKRGMVGVYQHIGKGHLHRYLSEFDFRYNSREVSDADRAIVALFGSEGKRLTYRDSCGRV